MSSSWSGRPRARWWAIFVLLVALPSVALAVAGLGAISADRIERENLWRQQAASTTQLAGTAIGTALSRIIAADPANPASGVTRFERDERGALVFPHDRVYVADFGVVPVSLGHSLPAREAGSDIPAEIVDALGGGPHAVERRRTVLGRLRAGSWWLHLDQRRAYDRELVRLLGDSADVPGTDARLDELARLEALIGAQPIAAGSGSVAVPATDGVELIAGAGRG